jgi:hypothetical protein
MDQKNDDDNLPGDPASQQAGQSLEPIKRNVTDALTEYLESCYGKDLDKLPGTQLREVTQAFLSGMLVGSLSGYHKQQYVACLMNLLGLEIKGPFSQLVFKSMSGQTLELSSVQQIVERFIDEAPHRRLETYRPERVTVRVGGLDLIKTCEACPEQYEVFLGGVPVGYLRLRHGTFRADAIAVGGPTVYSQDGILGDGEFLHEQDRAKHLLAAVRALAGWWDKRLNEQEQPGG